MLYLLTESNKQAALCYERNVNPPCQLRMKRKQKDFDPSLLMISVTHQSIECLFQFYSPIYQPKTCKQHPKGMLFLSLVFTSLPQSSTP